MRYDSHKPGVIGVPSREVACVIVSTTGTRCRRPGVVWLGHEGRICETHAHQIWCQVEKRDTDNCDKMIAGSERREHLRSEARKKRSVERRKPSAAGQIYFVLVDGLIKVGWTSKLADRIRAYGPKAVLLAHYPGSRSDETALHKQLTPARSHGREWYHDGDVVRLFVTEALAKHGPPRFDSIAWTEPKQTVAGKRAARYR